jgi:predicted dehydrogenase
MSNIFRVGIIGAGSIAQQGHLPGLRRVPNVEVVSICDTNIERARAAAVSNGVGRVYTDWKEMISNGSLDGVTIATPNTFHAEMAVAALESGLHVFCEKPMATKLTDGEAMVAAANRIGKVLAINMQTREVPAVEWMRKAVQSGKLGNVHYVKAWMFRRAGIPGFGSWFTRRELSGGGVLMDIGVHMLDAVLWMLNFPEVRGVTAELQSIQGPRGRGLCSWGAEHFTNGRFDVEDFAAVHLRLARGGLVTIEVTWAVYGPNEMRIQLLGTDGGLDLDGDRYGSDTPLRYYHFLHDRPVDESPVLRRLEGSAWNVTTSRFVAAARGEDAVACTGEEGLRVLRIVEAAYRSADQGREILL